ncbi:MAG TPA: hypothetical protein VE196_03780 [Pseudonocardiaceae bacterium]|nr:hypothetical protein [Pseudonocardiaceae bacterium]
MVEPVHRGWRSNRDTEAYQRRAVLAEPTLAAELTWLDGLALGFLVALACRSSPNGRNGRGVGEL